MIALESLSFSYGAGRVLDGVDLIVDRPGVYPLAGLNGGGKTTLLKLIAGLLAPDRGRVLVGGGEPSRVGALARAGLVSYVPQEDDVSPDVGVGELLQMALFRREPRYWRADFGRRGERIVDSLELASLLEARYGELSGGQKRKVLVAAGFLQDAPVVVLDEPLAFLDPKRKGEVESFVESWVDRVVVVAGHDLPFIERHFERAVCLRDGKVVRAGREDFVREVYG